MERGYPEREHLETPTNAFEVIEGELRLYPDGVSFRNALNGLHKIYGRSLYGISLQTYAIRVSAARVLQTGNHHDLDDYSRMWYAGSMLGVYAASLDIEPKLRSVVVDYALDGDIEPLENESEQSRRIRLAQQYAEDTEQLIAAMEQIPEDKRDILSAAAERACEGFSQSCEEAFVAGILSAMSFITGTTENARFRRRPVRHA